MDLSNYKIKGVYHVVFTSITTASTVAQIAVPSIALPIVQNGIILSVNHTIGGDFTTMSLVMKFNGCSLQTTKLYV